MFIKKQIENKILIPMEDENQKNQKDVAEQLLLLIKNKNGNITYKELSDNLSFKPDPHTVLPKILGNVNSICNDLDLPIISALVVNKDSKLPGDGFLEICREYGKDIENLTAREVYHNERQAIRDCNKWQDLADYFEIDLTMPTYIEAIYPDEISKEEVELMTEGSVDRVAVNIYERNPELRRKCIEHYGPICQICGFDFGKVYGQEFAGMIHVHHIFELSKIKKEHEVNPIEDLIPVCPNCHMVLHSKVHCSIDELKEKIKNKKHEFSY